jgi:hypothetical protein
MAQIMGYEASHSAYGCHSLSLAGPGYSIPLLNAIEMLILVNSENLLAS